MTQERSTRGVDAQGQQFKIDDIWDKPSISISPMIPWTGGPMFLVDKIHIDRWGTDQRRKRVEASNLTNSQSEKEFDLFDEESHSAKSRWTALGD